jgi:hypothetical protein
MFQIIVSVDTVIGTLSDSTMTTSAFAFRWYGYGDWTQKSDSESKLYYLPHDEQDCFGR